MKNNPKEKIIIAIIIAIICIITFTVFNSKKPKENLVEDNKMLEVKNTENYKIVNGNVSYEKEKMVFKADIKNISNKELPAKNLKVEFLDNDGNKVGEVSIYVEKLKANEMTGISSQIWNGAQNISNYKIVE